MGRFDYVQYDEMAQKLQQDFKTEFEKLEAQLSTQLSGQPRPLSLAMNALEECYMWIGKGIRDDQIDRNGSAPLQEERTNS